jgi:hypothetical protein
MRTGPQSVQNGCSPEVKRKGDARATTPLEWVGRAFP